MIFIRFLMFGYLVFCSIVILNCSEAGSRSSVSNSSIEGVWQYMEDDVLQEIQGMSFFTEKHFAFVVNFKLDSNDASQKILAHSGTYVLQDSIVTATIHHSHNPALIGQKIRWIHGVEDRIASYKVLDVNSRIVECGRVRRLE